MLDFAYIVLTCVLRRDARLRARVRGAGPRGRARRRSRHERRNLDRGRGVAAALLVYLMYTLLRPEKF